MEKFVFTFTILAIVVLYSVSVDCKHRNKFHHMSKNHLKHLHGRITDKSVKRDLSKQYAHGYQPELDVNKNFPSIHSVPRLHMHNINAQEAVKTQNGTINETQDKNQKVISEEKSIVQELGDKSQDKSQQNVGLPSFVESKSNVSGGLNVQTVPLGNAAPKEIINNETALFVSPVLKVEDKLEDLNKPVIKQSVIVSHSLDVEPLQQPIDAFNRTANNETASFESRRFDVQPVPQINTALKEFTNNKISYFKSRSLDVQPIQRSALNASNDSPLENSGSLNKQPSLQGNPALEESMSNNTARILVA